MADYGGVFRTTKCEGCDGESGGTSPELIEAGWRRVVIRVDALNTKGEIEIRRFWACSKVCHTTALLLMACEIDGSDATLSDFIRILKEELNRRYGKASES